MEVKVAVTLNPTESRDKVSKAVEMLFPGVKLSGDELLEGEIQDITRFRELLAQRKVRNTFESILAKNYCAGSTYLLLNKQAAFMGKPNVFAGQELGPIKLEISCKEGEIHKIIWGI
ncbi:MAG: hypothetical protein J7L23_00375 [Candidatus Diapherotrites archaeon]|nr:hypothetical protein [Candidatus Diapherotrites archaeon]